MFETFFVFCTVVTLHSCLRFLMYLDAKVHINYLRIFSFYFIFCFLYYCRLILPKVGSETVRYLIDCLINIGFEPLESRSN